MVDSKKHTSKHRPLASPFAFFSMAFAFVVALVYCWPLVVRRGKSALDGESTSLSLSYARMALRDDPEDAQLRLKLAQRLIPLGAWHEVEDILAPLLARTDELGKRARLVRLSISYHRLLAAPVDSSVPSENEGLRERFEADLRASAADADGTGELTALAELASAADVAHLRASLEARAAEVSFTESERGAKSLDGLLLQIQRADGAFLAMQKPESSVEFFERGAEVLFARRDGRAGGLVLAAMGRAREGGDVKGAFEISQRWVSRLPDVMELRVARREAAAEVGPETALAVALAELQELPNDPVTLRAAVRWALWAEREELALDLLSNACLSYPCEPEEWRTFTELSTVRGALRLLLHAAQVQAELYGLPPERLEQLIDLHEALGQPARSLALLRASPTWAARGARSRYWAANLARRAGAVEREVEFLRGMVALGGRLDRTTRMRLADGYAALGRPHDSLEVMALGLHRQRPQELRRLRALALQYDELELAESAGLRLLESSVARVDDVALQAELLTELAQTRRAVSTLLAGYERFGDKSLLHRVLRVYEASSAPASALRALDDLSTRYASALSGPEPTRMRIGLHHRLASAAEASGDRQTALQHLLLASREFRHLGQRTEWEASDRSLWLANRRSTLAVGLSTDDREAIVLGYDALSGELSVGQRVLVLRRLGRHEEALSAALLALRSEQWESERERDELAQAAATLERQQRRTFYAGGGLIALPGVVERGLHARATWSLADLAVLVGAEVKEWVLSGAAADQRGDRQQVRPALGLSFSGQTARVRGLLGLDVRMQRPLRPTAEFEVELSSDALQLSSAVELNAVPSSTAALRSQALQHSARVTVAVDLGLPFVQGSLSGQTYRGRVDDGFLGAGAVARLDLGLRDHWSPLSTEWNVRLIGQAQPTVRSDSANSATLLPQSAVFVGAGAGLVRGDLLEPRLWGRDVSLVVDAACGWLLPQQALGFFGTAGAGVPVLGTDMLALRFVVDNVRSGPVGQTNLGVRLDYALSFLR